MKQRTLPLALLALGALAVFCFTGCQMPPGGEKVTLTFDRNLNDGGRTPGSRDFLAGDVLIDGDLPVLSAYGGSYTFNGWYTQAEGGEKIGTGFRITDSMKLYARWSGVIYTISFDPNGGAVNPENATRNVQLPATTLKDFPPFPTNNGNAFLGWYTEAAGGTEFTPDSTVNRTMTVYARWNSGAKTFTVTFDPNRGAFGEGSPQTKTVNAPTATTVDSLPNEPTRSGYGFAGWYTQASGGKPFTAGTPVSKDTTVYAHWSLENAEAALELRYEFNGNANDSAGSNNGTLSGGAVIETEDGVGVLNLGTGNGYLDMGAEAGTILTGNADYTIATWVFIDNGTNVSGNGWMIWAFSDTQAASSGSGKYMFFRASDTRCAISASGWNNEKVVSYGTALPKGEWVHVAYSQEGDTGTIFLNGEAVKSGSRTVSTTDLGTLTYNWIGRPPFNNDNYMKGTKYADFRIYSTALDADTVVGVMAESGLGQ
ncbi:MAG: InlB B-repeat-containing protein [Treponema sp.]|jgi:uncharacterized repeat protein (TIGR02543 family)|nr:InlB B-repeat-containing protein [Treponema sp.]